MQAITVLTFADITRSNNPGPTLDLRRSRKPHRTRLIGPCDSRPADHVALAIGGSHLDR
jgi:hypothetical protein